jgi:hypothetical protein
MQRVPVVGFHVKAVWWSIRYRTYAAKAFGLYGDSKARRDCERAGWWEQLASELRPSGFLKGL